ncbi:MAG: N-acetyl-gamma-glutamyl-phosphate reductase [Myxococcota bacterium]
MRVAVIGASGYTGLELLRILSRHAQFEVCVATSEQRAGAPVGEVFPSLRDIAKLDFEANDPDSIASRVDLAFTALPHSASAATVLALRRAGVRVVDLSADFRLRDVGIYRAWYGDHPAPQLIETAVYGLPELYRERLADTGLVAVPGCYPTSALLPLVPLLRQGLVATDGIVIDSKSGVSGAGRKLDEQFLFAELDDNCFAYKVGNQHRHVPEIEQEASFAAGSDISVTFVPHLLPTIRGIATSIYLRPNSPMTTEDAHRVLEEAYADERFVRVLPAGQTPRLASVRGSNFCDVAAYCDTRTNTLILLSALDNLVKGASGGAVQSANVMCGYPEETALLEAPLVP